MTRNNTLLLVVARCVASELEDLGGQVLEYSREVDYQGHIIQRAVVQNSSRRRTRCAGANALCVVAVLEQTVDTTDGELQAGLGRPRLRLAGCITARGRLASLARLAAFARLEHGATVSEPRDTKNLRRTISM